jgi:hypothetical protein
MEWTWHQGEASWNNPQSSLGSFFSGLSPKGERRVDFFLFKKNFQKSSKMIIYKDVFTGKIFSINIAFQIGQIFYLRFVRIF